MTELRTDRLVLRRWRDSDLAPWAAMNADPAVREHLGPVLAREQTDAQVALFEAEFDSRGFGWWAVETRAAGDFIGFTGFDVLDESTPATGVEIGWRLARHAWGHGYATEAARAALAFGFGTLCLPEILAVTAAVNHRSRAVMHRLGMTHDPADAFDDTQHPEGPLRRQVLYRLGRDAYLCEGDGGDE